MNSKRITASDLARCTSVLLLTLVLLVATSRCVAQIPFSDRPFWYTQIDSTSQRAVVFSWDRFFDEQTDWVCNRMGISGILPTGDYGIFFLRMHWVSFDSGDLQALDRWPDLRAESAVAPEEPDAYDWPYERRMVGYGRPDLGLINRLRLPLLSEFQYGIALGLPVGRDRLYPFSAADIPIQCELRKQLSLDSHRQLTLLYGWIKDIDSSRDFWQPEAFPAGTRYGARFAWRFGPRRLVAVSLIEESFPEMRSSRLGFRYEMPTGDRHSFAIDCEREIIGTLYRPAATYVRLLWCLRGQ